MAFSRLSTGRTRRTVHSAEFACELGGKVGGIVAITRAPLARTMSGNVVDPIAGLSEVPLNHADAPPSRRSKRTMSQVRRVCPPDAELKRHIRRVLLSDPDMRFGSAVTMATRQRCMKQIEVRRSLHVYHHDRGIARGVERLCNWLRILNPYTDSREPIDPVHGCCRMRAVAHSSTRQVSSTRRWNESPLVAATNATVPQSGWSLQPHSARSCPRCATY